MGKDELVRRVCEQLDTYHEAAIELQRGLVACVALGPESDGDGEVEKAAFLTDLLIGWGLKVKNYPAPDDRVPFGMRPNLVAYLPGKRPEKI